MTALVTIVIPVASYHLTHVARAIASAQAQTVPCDILPLLDEHGHGAGAMRNQGLKQVSTEFVCFLDADDELQPAFVERCVAVYRQTRRYVFTDFYDHTGAVHHAPECAWVDRTWHAVTTLLPTAWAKAVNGFDEKLKANEDTDFYVKLNTANYCGIRLPEPLMTYHTVDGKRHAALDEREREQFHALMDSRYRGKVMACCGTPPPASQALSDSYGTVQARPKWGYGKRVAIGAVSGRNYGRIDSGYTVAIDPRDAQARPDLWDVIPEAKAELSADEDEPDATDDIGDLFASLVRVTKPRMAAPPPPTPPPAAVPVAVKPDVARVVRLGASVPAVHLKRDPIFVFSSKDYDSYTDVRRLVELSGFEAVKLGTVEGRDPASRFIFLSPEQPPPIPVRPDVIWWALEYGGDYEPDLSNWRGEVWASDPAWAAAHDAKFVLMGSHPRLNDATSGLVIPAKKYDVTMLAYMTHRRQVIREQLSDLRWSENVYPGYGIERHADLTATRLMLHVHQGDWQAIAPQRIALAAAYNLPVVHETVPDAGAYGDVMKFEPYQKLTAATRALVNMDALPNFMGGGLYELLCVKNTFRACVEGALK